MFFDQSYRAINARTCIKVHLLAQCKEILLISSMKWLCTFIKRNIVFYIIIVSHIHYFFLNVVFEILRTGVQNFVGVFFQQKLEGLPYVEHKITGLHKMCSGFQLDHPAINLLSFSQKVNKAGSQLTRTKDMQVYLTVVAQIHELSLYNPIQIGFI